MTTRVRDSPPSTRVDLDKLICDGILRGRIDSKCGLLVWC